MDNDLVKAARKVLEYWKTESESLSVEIVNDLEAALNNYVGDTNGSVVCEVCWTSAWQPCEKDTPNAVKDMSTGGWMVCGMCVHVEYTERVERLLISLVKSIPPDGNQGERRLYEWIKAKYSRL